MGLGEKMMPSARGGGGEKEKEKDKCRRRVLPSNPKLPKRLTKRDEIEKRGRKEKEEGEENQTKPKANWQVNDAGEMNGFFNFLVKIIAGPLHLLYIYTALYVMHALP
jgi:hypothetical protein